MTLSRRQRSNQREVKYSLYIISRNRLEGHTIGIVMHGCSFLLLKNSEARRGLGFRSTKVAASGARNFFEVRVRVSGDHFRVWKIYQEEFVISSNKQKSSSNAPLKNLWGFRKI